MTTSVQGDPDGEDACLGEAVLERIRLGEEKTYSLAEVMEDLGMDPSAA
jgi:hypothetical protein